jgi:hypothetical protein
MSKPAFFVDGQTEQRALHQLCPGQPIRIIGCNGITVTMEAIAKRLATHIKLLNNRNYPIVVLIDREGRKESVIDIKEELELEIAKFNLNLEILIGVCDRMIENWILADKENFKSYIGLKKKLKEKTFEGLSGKPKLKKYYPEYHETTDGVKLLSSSNPQVLYDSSPSFNLFVNTVKGLNCEWLNNIE